MSTGVWIFLGLVVLGFLIARSRRSGTSEGELDLDRELKKADALALDLANDCVKLALALPIVDKESSWLFHDPVYDAGTDMFDPPCREADFRHETGRCWTSRESLPQVFSAWAGREARFELGLSRPRTDAVVQASEHLDIVTCYHSVNEPGLRVVRLSRVAEDRWHTHVWVCGLAPGAGSIAMETSDGHVNILLASDSGRLDPPLLATDVAEDPSLWTKRIELVGERWRRDGSWREAADLCTHASARPR